MKNNKVITYIFVNLLVCTIYFFYNYSNFKIYNEIDISFTKNSNFSRENFYNLDILHINNTSIKKDIFTLSYGNFKSCLISEISKSIYPTIQNPIWKKRENPDGISILLEFNSNENKTVNANLISKCIYSNFNDQALYLLNNKYNFLQRSIDVVERYEKFETKLWKINSVVEVYGLPYMNKLKLEELEALKNMSVDNEKLFITIKGVTSYVVEGYKSKIEILVSLLLMINILTYSFFIMSYQKLKILKRRIFK